VLVSKVFTTRGLHAFRVVGPFMALSIPQSFAQFKTNLEITYLQSATVSTRQNGVRDVLAAGFIVKESFLTGSYARSTMILGLTSPFRPSRGPPWLRRTGSLTLSVSKKKEDLYGIPRLENEGMFLSPCGGVEQRNEFSAAQE
jgi:hypothetical protein